VVKQWKLLGVIVPVKIPHAAAGGLPWVGFLHALRNDKAGDLSLVAVGE